MQWWIIPKLCKNHTHSLIKIKGTIVGSQLQTESLVITAESPISLHRIHHVILMEYHEDQHMLYVLPQCAGSFYYADPQFSTEIQTLTQSRINSQDQLRKKLEKLLEIIRKFGSLPQISQELSRFSKEGLVQLFRQIYPTIHINLLDKFRGSQYYQIEICKPYGTYVIQIKAAIDTGAGYNVVSPNYSKKLNLDTITMAMVEGVTAGPVLMPIVTIKIKLHGFVETTHAVVLPQILDKYGTEFVIGQDVFNWDLYNRKINLQEVNA